MQTVGELIERVLPRGSRGDGSGWNDAPLWPPDVFAVAASLLKMTEAYAHPDVRGGVRLGQRHAKTTREMGLKWAEAPMEPGLDRWRRTQWQRLRDSWAVPLTGYRAEGDRLAPWALAALRLFAAADEAATGIGFGGTSALAKAALAVAADHQARSLCLFADSTETVVQPKARTPSVGCNLRSLSLNLSLLPPTTTVNSLHLGVQPVMTAERAGVLVVPFPYELDDASIIARSVPRQRWGRLQFDTRWGKSPSPRALAAFIGSLLRSANRGSERIRIVVLPELALSTAQHDAVWAEAKRQGVQLMLAGVHGRSQNVAVGTMRGRKQDPKWDQKKHHRWKVERYQIQNYALPLDPSKSWWEDIDVTGRTVVAARLRRSSTVACLVCEDLARVEPVQPVLREMGVSFLVALLMDGPQYRHRWSSKSATVFAEDPGSAVLTVTSAALMRRYHRHRERHANPVSSPIGLWQDADGSSHEIALEPDAHAVRFTIEFTEKDEVTLDGRLRSARGELVRLLKPAKGAAFHSITAPDAPRWARPLFRSQS